MYGFVMQTRWGDTVHATSVTRRILHLLFSLCFFLRNLATPKLLGFLEHNPPSCPHSFAHAVLLGWSTLFPFPLHNHCVLHLQDWTWRPHSCDTFVATPRLDHVLHLLYVLTKHPNFCYHVPVTLDLKLPTHLPEVWVDDELLRIRIYYVQFCNQVSP